MKWFFRILVGFLVVVLALLTVWIAVRLNCSPSSYSPAEVTPLIVAAGVLVALISLATNQRREASEEYLENANNLLSKAYETLNSSSDNHGHPKNSRIHWLTASRLIRTAENIADLITVESHLRIWREQKEYWRGRLRDLIFPDKDGFPKEYYAAKPEHMITWSDVDQEPLSLTSLAVLYRFIRWPESIEDPLQNEAPFTEREIWEMEHLGPKGLGKLLREVEQIRTKKK